MNEIVKSETTATIAVITESQSTQGKFYISIEGEGNGYDDYADTIEQAREIAVNLIADWDGFESEPTDPAEDEYNRFMDAINADDTETLEEIADNAWEYTPTAEATMNQYEAEKLIRTKFGIKVTKSGFEYLSFASGTTTANNFDVTIPYNQNDTIDIEKTVLLIKILASLLPEGTPIGNTDPRSDVVIAGDLK